MITTMIVSDCGPLGDVALTISYRYVRAYRGSDISPQEPATASIHWIKIGGPSGVEVGISDDFLRDEIIPHCVADWEEEATAAAVQYAESVRAEYRERAGLWKNAA